MNIEIFFLKKNLEWKDLLNIKKINIINKTIKLKIPPIFLGTDRKIA